jgi:hypothetical protein
LLTSLEPVKTEVGVEKMYRPDRCFDNCPGNTPLLQFKMMVFVKIPSFQRSNTGFPHCTFWAYILLTL